jgi:hypothetical protein
MRRVIRARWRFRGVAFARSWDVHDPFGPGCAVHAIGFTAQGRLLRWWWVP